MVKSKDASKWTNIRALKIDVAKWTKFLRAHDLGSLPAFTVKAINDAIAKEKKRLK